MDLIYNPLVVGFIFMAVYCFHNRIKLSIMDYLEHRHDDRDK